MTAAEWADVLAQYALVADDAAEEAEYRELAAMLRRLAVQDALLERAEAALEAVSSSYDISTKTRAEACAAAIRQQREG